jgi:hypothetical protein
LQLYFFTVHFPLVAPNATLVHYDGGKLLVYSSTSEGLAVILRVRRSLTICVISTEVFSEATNFAFTDHVTQTVRGFPSVDVFNPHLVLLVGFKSGISLICFVCGS